MEGGEYNNRLFAGQFQLQIYNVVLKWAQISIEWNRAVFKTDGCFKSLLRNTGNTFANFLLAKPFISGAFFYASGGEMYFASAGRDNNTRNVMKRNINHYGLILLYVKLTTANSGFQWWPEFRTAGRFAAGRRASAVVDYGRQPGLFALVSGVALWLVYGFTGGWLHVKPL